MSQRKIDLAKLLKNYKSGWVGISEDFKSVVLSAKTLRAAHNKAKKLNKKIYFFPSGKSYDNFVG